MEISLILKKMDIVLLHRNLRIKDNEALYYGSQNQKYLVIYLFDKDYWNSNGKSSIQFQFAYDCLVSLDNELKELRSNIHIFEGNLYSLQEWIIRNYPKANIHFNHSTDIDYFRSQLNSFKQFFNAHDQFHTYSDHGIQLDNFDRDNWSKHWHKIMDQPLKLNPKANLHWLDVDIPTLNKLDPKIKDHTPLNMQIQKGGSLEADRLLDSFLFERCEGYSKKMSSPIDAENSCSRLSPHIAFGSISIRQIYQKLTDFFPVSNHKSDLNSFRKRLYWHCHFIQKLETEPELEFNSMHSMCDELRPNFDSEIVERWIQGKTGFPFLDACILYLKEYGWINFRMRAMIMSFASYNLWQPWQKTSPLLAKLFVDYEPGIHISQVQMQSGVTGINLPRIYSVSKQSMDHDINADWIKRVIPELQSSDSESIHYANLGKQYIEPITDLRKSSKAAREKIWSIRSDVKFKNIAKKVYLKHGSRMRRRTA